MDTPRRDAAASVASVGGAGRAGWGRRLAGGARSRGFVGVLRAALRRGQ
jgi:hypothetical protein